MLQKQSKIIVLFFVVFLILLYNQFYLHIEIAGDIADITSNNYRERHISQHNSWHENTLSPFMFLPISPTDAKTLGNFNSNNLLVTFKKKEVKFISGNKWAHVCSRAIDGKRHLLPQWVES
jgi:hypothetical protein